MRLVRTDGSLCDGLAYRGGKYEGRSYDEWLWLGRWIGLGVWEGGVGWVGRCVSGVGIV